MTLLRLALAFLALLLAWGTQTPSKADERAGLFEWFDSLGYGAIRDGQFVCVKASYKWGGQVKTREPVYGFLVSEGAKQFTILTLDLSYARYPSSWPWPKEEASYQPADFAKWVADQRTSKGSDQFLSGMEGPLTKRGSLFVIARACDARGLKAESADFLQRAKIEHSDYRREKADFKVQLADDIATHATWEAISGFGDARVSRKELLARFEHIVRDFPAGPRSDVAKETLATLRIMVAEEEAHQALSAPLEQLPADTHVAELIFQLRDQPGYQNSVPGYPDIFEGLASRPANRLVKLGFAAVPQLLDTLHDGRFTRAMQMVRFTGFSKPILFKDAAREILSRIAHRPLTPEPGPKTIEEWEIKTEQVARAWWKKAQEKGERRTLIEGVEVGDWKGAQQAQYLAEKYPSSAVAAIRVGLARAKDGSSRETLIDALMPVHSSEALEVAKKHMRSGGSLRERLAGAKVVSSFDADAAVGAMISECEKLRRRSGDEVGSYLVDFLAGSARADAVRALAANLASRDVDTRRDTVQAFFAEIPPNLPWGYPKQGKRPQSAKEKNAYRNAVEDLLAAALRDTALAVGGILNYEGESFDHPRVCDLAASEMAIIWPSRYSYRVTPSLSARDEMRMKALNSWRSRHNLKPLPSPRVSAAIRDRGTSRSQ